MCTSGVKRAIMLTEMVVIVRLLLLLNSNSTPTHMARLGATLTWKL